MSAADKFQLIVYEGDYGLPSFDVDSTKLILYSRISKLPVQVKLLNSWKQCTFYSSPTFVHKNVKFTTFADSVLYLRTLNYNIDSELSVKQCSELLAMTNYVLHKLKPLLEFIYWADPRNREELTSIWFTKAVPFPFNYYHVGRHTEKALALIQNIFCVTTHMDVVREYLNKAASECLSVLSKKLGNNEYFYGSTPSSLDVIVYSYIAPLVKVSFPNGDFCNIVSVWPNLHNFVKRIDSEYFSDIPKQTKFIKHEDKTKTSDEDVSYIAIVILSVSATSLMLGFAVSRGLISIKSIL